jgi:hypothetical protein
MIADSEMSVLRCMKDGAVAESGTHEELIKLNGEYSKLYNIQANAFCGENVSDVSPISALFLSNLYSTVCCRVLQPCDAPS